MNTYRVANNLSKDGDRLLLPLILLSVFVTSGQAFANDPSDQDKDFITPTRELTVPEMPSFADDLDFEGIELAISRQIRRYDESPTEGTVRFGDQVYSKSEVRNSLATFSLLIRELRLCRIWSFSGSGETLCWRRFNEQIVQHYRVFIPDLLPGDPRYNEPSPIFYTGYYTPHLEVSKAQQGEYQYPIYRPPEDEWYSRIGRYLIDFRQELKGRGLELFYAKNLYDVYLLQIEGGGRLTYRENGQNRATYLSYAGSNGRQWRFISQYMLKKNLISDPSVAAQRAFLDTHPERHAEVFSFCPGYVYFRETEHPPEGSDRVPLTDGRSIATDRRHYGFKGILSFVSTQRPKDIGEDDPINFSRFVLDQDTGGAIRGKGRVDFYFGEGAYAEYAAHRLKARGDLYFLLPRRVIDP